MLSKQNANKIPAPRIVKIDMPRFHVEPQWNPAEPTGGDLILLKSTMHDVERLAAGREGTIYRTLIEDEKHKRWIMVIKKFNRAKGLMGKDLTELKEKELETRLCQRTSENAQIFRKAGLPVLPYVKSFLSEKDILSERFRRKLPKLKPPFVVMTKLLTATGVGNELQWYNQNLLGGLLHENPITCDQMVIDLAKMHKIGFTMAAYNDEERHPIHTLWNFTVDADGKLERWMVDLSNVESKNRLPLDDREEIFNKYVSEDLKDILFLMRTIPEQAFNDAYFKYVYQQEIDRRE